MKKNIILFILFFGIQIGIIAQSEYSGQHFANLLSGSDQDRRVFQIEDYYQQYKGSIESDDLLLLFYKAFIAKNFNNLQGSIDALHRIIEGEDTNTNYGMANLMRIQLAEAYFDAQEYQKAIEIADEMATITTKDTTFNENERNFFLEGAKYFKKISTSGLRCFPEKMEIIDTNPADTNPLKLIRNEKSDEVFFNAKWNNQVLKTHFDTGASISFFINRAKAEAAGVKIFTNDTVLLNERQKGLLGRIDSLELGKFKVKNIPAFVLIEEVNKKDPHQAECDSVSNNLFDIIIGLPIIKELGVIDIDFEQNTISFPVNHKTTSNERRNISISYGNNMNMVLHLDFEVEGEKFTSAFDTGGNFGLSINSDFYTTHQNKISTLSEKNRDRSFIGGCSESNLYIRDNYLSRNVNIRIADSEIQLKDDCVVSKDKENDDVIGLEYGGALGNDIFKYCRQAIFDFNNMKFSIEK